MLRYISRKTKGKLAFNIGLNVFFLYNEQTGRDIEKDLARGDLKSVLKIIYLSLQDGARRAKEAFPYEQIEDFMDDFDDGEFDFTEIMEVLIMQVSGGEVSEAVKNKFIEETKKKKEAQSQAEKAK